MFESDLWNTNKDIASQSREILQTLFCTVWGTNLLPTYSETRLIRTLRGHAIVSVLSGCLYEGVSLKKRHGHIFYRS